MIEERRTINSQFDNQLEEFNTDSEYQKAVPEVGAIIYANGYPFYGDGNQWNQLAKLTDIPIGSNAGYQVAEDTTYTNVNNAQTLTAVEEIIYNDNGNRLGNLSEYNGDKFYFRNEVIYTVTISFTAQVSANNQHAQLFFGTSGIPYNGYSDVLYFAKGNNVAHSFSRTYQIVGDDATEQGGINLYLFPSHAGKMWNAKFTIQRAF